jgi:hypothetical protein
MKFIKKLFKKQKKEIGGCGTTTVYLDKDFEVSEVNFSGSGGGSGGSFSKCCPHCGNAIYTFDGSSDKV